MKKTTKQKYKKIIPFAITAVASVSLSLAMFMVFAAGHFDRLAKTALTAATLDALQEDLPEGVAPFYKITSFSKNAPGDNDVVGIPVLSLRDRILLSEPSGEVKVALYNKTERSDKPYFSYTIGNGNEQSYVAGDYGAGEFVIVTTQLTDCWDLALAACASLADKITEWHYKVVADTYTYILAPLDKRDVAIRNARKNLGDQEITGENTEAEQKGVVETIVEAVTGLIGGSDPAQQDESDTESAEPETESGGFQILPSDESGLSDESVSEVDDTSSNSVSSESSDSSDSGNESLSEVTSEASAPPSEPDPAPAPPAPAPAAESGGSSEGNNE